MERNRDNNVTKNAKRHKVSGPLDQIVERTILNRIKKHTSEENIIPPQQFHFRECHTTETQILRIIRYANVQ